MSSHLESKKERTTTLPRNWDNVTDRPAGDSRERAGAGAWSASRLIIAVGEEEIEGTDVALGKAAGRADFGRGVKDALLGPPKKWSNTAPPSPSTTHAATVQAIARRGTEGGGREKAAARSASDSLPALTAGTLPMAFRSRMTPLSTQSWGRWKMAGTTAEHTTDEALPVSARERWFSRRALALHAAVLVLAPGCAAAGWWQATRALAGNGLSWVYSIEWPIFAVLALWGWWHLVHEDPEVRADRKALVATGGTGREGFPAAGGLVDSAAVPEAVTTPAVDDSTYRAVRRVRVVAGVDLLLGFVAIFAVPFSRPSGWLPARGEIVYLAHAALGLAAVVGAGLLVLRTRDSTRLARIVAWLGFAGLGLAGCGGLLTAARSLPRFLGMAVMLVGAITALCGYLIPVMERARARALSG
jgi:hypothetical protein